MYEAEKIVSYPHLTEVSIPGLIKIPKKTHAHCLLLVL